jgi:hypothetical protein
MVVSPEHDVMNGGVVRQHAGDDLAHEHVAILVVDFRPSAANVSI